ncbi:MAG: hydrogenase maturation protease [Betaproteobacteria bacterium]|nr:hydrogenase maturation protease [Betaproteobacteria bacterium]
MTTPPSRILVVGVGNVLHGDDGFGVVLAARLATEPWPPGVKIMETGIGGISIVQELMTGYAAVLLLDAHRAGGPPGVLRLLAPSLPELGSLDVHARRDYFSDTHYATPIRALALLEAIGHLPPRVAILGCEPGEHERLAIGLSAPVAAAMDRASELAHEWVTAESAAANRSS